MAVEPTSTGEPGATASTGNAIACPDARPSLARILAGERRAIARAITRIENAAPGADDLAHALEAHRGHATVIGITGPPGAGKSTLINALLGELVRRGLSIAVVAVDPASPITGGAVLGDRVRMGEHGAHERVFIRSVSSRGHMGGLSRTTGTIVDVFDTAGFDVVIVETVGAGQSEVEITALADVRLVVCPPGLGDDVQAIKAGILEIADVFVVNKGDLPAADATMRDLRDMLRLRRHGRQDVAVLKTTATRGEGIAEVVDAALAHVGKSGRGRRFAQSRAISRDDIAAVDRALAARRVPAAFADRAVPRSVIASVLAAACNTPALAGMADARCVRIEALAGSARERVMQSLAPATPQRTREWLLTAPVLMAIAAATADAYALLACGCVIQSLHAAAAARGLDAVAIATDPAPVGPATSAAAHAVAIVALGYCPAGTPLIELDRPPAACACIGFD